MDESDSYISLLWTKGNIRPESLYCLNLLNMENGSWLLDIEYDDGYKWVDAINQFAEICTCFNDFLYQNWGKYA